MIPNKVVLVKHTFCLRIWGKFGMGHYACTQGWESCGSSIGALLSHCPAVAGGYEANTNAFSSWLSDHPAQNLSTRGSLAS